MPGMDILGSVWADHLSSHPIHAVELPNIDEFLRCPVLAEVQVLILSMSSHVSRQVLLPVLGVRINNVICEYEL